MGTNIINLFLFSKASILFEWGNLFPLHEQVLLCLCLPHIPIGNQTKSNILVQSCRFSFLHFHRASTTSFPSYLTHNYINSSFNTSKKNYPNTKVNLMLSKTRHMIANKIMHIRQMYVTSINECPKYSVIKQSVIPIPYITNRPYPIRHNFGSISKIHY